MIKKTWSRGGWISYLSVAALSVALGTGAAVSRGTAEEPDPGAINQAKSLSRAFRSAAEIALPSVVKIESRVKARPARARTGANGENPFRGTPFERFFDEHGQDMLNTPNQPQSGLGTGVIIDKSGLILTNNHVVEGADEVVVKLHDGREFKSTEIKTDPRTDLAVIRINGAGSLEAARIGNSDALETGDWVIAIGNPFNQENSVSAGIISGKGRQLRTGNGENGARAKYLQTDAAINPGNSGGPLVSLDGEVIGINTAIASSSGGYQGIGFAIPINLAKWVTDQLIERGNVQRGYLGVSIEPVSNEEAQALGMANPQGALITQVFENTPAATAGLEAGDVVTNFSGRAIHNPGELQEFVERTEFGSNNEVKVWRDGKEHTLSVVVKPLPEDFAAVLPSERPSANEEGNSKSATFLHKEMGMQVSDMTTEQAKQLGYEGRQGVLITEVDPSSLAAEAGLREGMLVLSVGPKRTAVANVGEFEKALEGTSVEKGVLLLIRGPRGDQHFAVVKKG